MSSVLAAQPPIACNIPVDAECFDASSFITTLPARGEQSVLASFQLHPQYCGVLTHFAQFTDDFAAHPASAQANCRTFTETGHQVCGTFLNYWTNNGALAQQGYPITEPLSETSDTYG